MSTHRFALGGGSLFLLGRDVGWILREVIEPLVHPFEHLANLFSVGNAAVSLLLVQRVVELLKLLGRVVGDLRCIVAARTQGLRRLLHRRSGRLALACCLVELVRILLHGLSEFFFDRHLFLGERPVILLFATVGIGIVLDRTLTFDGSLDELASGFESLAAIPHLFE